MPTRILRGRPDHKQPTSIRIDEDICYDCDATGVELNWLEGEDIWLCRNCWTPGEEDVN